VAISFRLHSELDVDVLMDSVQVFKLFSQLAGSMWPDDECVFYVAKPAEGLMDRRLQSHSFKVLHEVVCSDWRKRRNHRHIVGLLVELAIEAEKGGSQDMAEMSQDRLIKVPAFKAQGLLNERHGEKRNIKADEDVSESSSKGVDRVDELH
jgi:hypothetical protein